MRRWYQLGLLASALLLAGCAGAPPPEPDDDGPIEGRVGSVAVAFPDAGRSTAVRERAVRASTLVRQTARDWLEDKGRLAPDGPLAVVATLDSLRLRGAVATWLFAWAIPPDHLAARVVVSRAGRPVAGFGVRVESALAGYAWRDRGERLDRLSRRLGRRLAERLEGDL
jgi:hypothetical protein